MDKIKGKKYCTTNKGMQKTQYVSRVDAEKLHFACQYFAVKNMHARSELLCLWALVADRETDRGE
jgi:hypothetical protein